MPPKVVYPTGCKEVSAEMSKEELLKRLKVRTDGDTLFRVGNCRE
jgi:hypothetical protein